MHIMHTTDDLVARDAQVFLHQAGSSPCIGALRAVGGIWLEDTEGRRYIDLHGNTTHHIGHAHPRLIAAIKQQLDELTFSPRRFANELSVQLAEKLTAKFRGGHSRVLFATGGSDAIEIALRLCRVATGRSGIIALEGSYHGHGMGSLGLSSARLDQRLGSQLPDIHHITPYWDPIDGPQRMLDNIARILRQDGSRIACLIAEPIRSNCIVPPADLWRAVSDLCQRHSVKLVFDEIPSGLGKTGRFFTHEHFDVIPDIVVLGKALGGGILPIAAVLADDAFNVAPELNLGHYTHEKNPVTARAALTTLEIIEDENLVERADQLGAHVRRRLSERPESQGENRIRSVRGLGLLLAAELQPEGDAERLVLAAFRLGVSTTTKGKSAVGFSPPLTITESEIDLAIERLCAASAEVCERPGP